MQQALIQSIDRYNKENSNKYLLEMILFSSYNLFSKVIYLSSGKF